MNKILNIKLLEGVLIEECDNDNVYLCNDVYSFITPFPIKYLSNLLQSIIKIREDQINMSNPLFIGYSYTTINSWKIIDELNIIVDNNFIIIGITDDNCIVYSYDGLENKFPINWLSEFLNINK